MRGFLNKLDFKPVGLFVCGEETYFQIPPHVLNVFYDCTISFLSNDISFHEKLQILFYVRLMTLIFKKLFLLLSYSR